MLERLRALPRTEIVVLTLAIAVLALFAVLDKLAKEPAPPASYSSYDADSGGTRALYELLGREGLREDRFERRAVYLDRSTATLVWIEPLEFDPARRDPSKAETDALEAWVKAGGALLYIGHDNGAARSHYLKLPTATQRDKPTGEAYVDPSLAAYGIHTIAGKPGLRWRDFAGHVLVADSRGPLVVRYSYGRGLVTAVADEDLFSNAGIGLGDRPRLAYALATARAGTISFEEATHGHFVPEHWWMIAPRPLVIAVLVSVVVLAIALIGAAVRLGPPVIPAQRDVGTTNDFIGALAGLLQAGRGQRSAMVAAADSTTRALARAFGLGEGATANDVAERIDRDDRRRAYAQMLAVATNGYPDDRNLVTGIALAQQLRKDYAAHVDRRR
jgi:hypothetical protein